MSISVSNPARPGEIVSTYATTDDDEIDAILAKARAAQIAWAKVPQPQRGAILMRFLDVLHARRDEIAGIMTAEMGKLIGESRGEVDKGVAEGRMVAARAAAPMGAVLPSQTPGVVAYTTRRPRGVVLGIAPWNFPFSTPIRKAAPALLYGNAIILKPASLAPGAAVAIADAAAGILPDGLLQVVVGPGSLGDRLARHPGVDAVSFTGSVQVGRAVAEAAASHLAEISLELGGKNPVIVNDASDMDRALDQVYAAAFAVSGQRCTAISRVLVQRDIAAEVIRGLADRANAARLGDGIDPASTIGPLSSRRQRDDVAGFVARAVSQGARVEAGGETPEMEGWFYPPTILSGVVREMEIARQEVFGPVLAILEYGDTDEALSIANDVEFGLASALYSERTEVVEHFLSESESGMLHVNAGTFPENHMPFVGIKNSALGVGGSNGASTIQFYTSEHAIYRKARA